MKFTLRKNFLIGWGSTSSYQHKAVMHITRDANPRKTLCGKPCLGAGKPSVEVLETEDYCTRCTGSKTWNPIKIIAE